MSYTSSEVRFREGNEQKHNQIDKIIKTCNKEQRKCDREIKKLDYKLLINNLKQDRFQSIVDTLKDIEYANPNTMPMLFVYKNKVKEEAEEEA